jgi:hypothetical protein
MTQRWNGEIKLPMTQTPARVPPILLSIGALIPSDGRGHVTSSAVPKSFAARSTRDGEPA